MTHIQNKEEGKVSERTDALFMKPKRKGIQHASITMFCLTDVIDLSKKKENHPITLSKLCTVLLQQKTVTFQ